MIEGGGGNYPNCRQTRHDGDLPQGQVTHRKKLSKSHSVCMPCMVSCVRD